MVAQEKKKKRTGAAKKCAKEPKRKAPKKSLKIENFQSKFFILK
jgi:hypothetical protein